MHHAIADSDDEEDEIVVESYQSAVSRVLPEDGIDENAELATQDIAGTEQKSTGSTELLKRQLQSAARGLVTNSAPDAMPGPGILSSDSPSVQASKRRHTAGLASQSNGGSDRSVKRAKTLKTYGARRQSREVDDAEFDHQDANDALLRTSQSVAFTEHSGIQSSVALPSGTIQEDFRDHEPQVMFQDSGSTLMDDSSARDRLFEQAVGDPKNVDHSAADVPKSDQQHHLAPSWSPSRQIDSVSAHQEQLQYEEDAVNGTGKDVVGNPDQELTEENAPAHDNSGVQPSPMVEISVHENAASPAEDASASTQKSKRGRKRKAPEGDDADALVSDDRPVGLPQEQYKPRPSRRRETQIVEEPIDYSMRPEKAAKAKRTKSAHTGKTSTVSEGASTTSSEAASNEHANLNATTKLHDGDEQASQVQTAMTAGGEGHHEQAAHNRSESTKPDAPEQIHADAVEQVIVAEQRSEQETFVKPTKPTRTKETGGKPKRSHTTIFEDHVEFAGSKRGLSLSQRQADRKSSLQPIESQSSSKRKRKPVVSDDEDENEAPVGTDQPPESLDTSKDVKADADSKAVPKKRGRGRPPKSAAKAGIDTDNPEASTEKTEKDQAGEQSQHERPEPSVKDPDDSAIRTAAVDASAANADTDQPAQAHDEDGPTDVDETTTTAAVNPSPIELPTPSPEKQGVPQKASKATKGSPTSHSPINSTSKVRLRVGLSKRDRIQPLLRTMNPKQRV